MVKNHTSKRQTSSLGMSVGIGSAVALFITLVGAIICAAVLNDGKITEESMFAFSAVIWSLAAFLGALTASILSGRNMLAILIAGLTYFLLLLGGGLLFF